MIVFVESLALRARTLTLRTLALAFFCTLLLALNTSGGILCERLSLGSPHVAMAAGFAMAVSAGLLLLQTRRALSIQFRIRASSPSFSRSLFSSESSAGECVYRVQRSAIVGAQGLGALAGMAAVYALTRSGKLAGMPWLWARPTLLVNDLVAVVAIVLLVWSLASQLDTGLLVLALLLMSAFRWTAQDWCVDGAPVHFRVMVQHALVVQFAAVALLLLVWRENSLQTESSGSKE